MESQQMITYPEAMKLTGLPARTFYRRIASVKLPVYMDGKDRRKRLLDRRDVAKLIRVQEVERSTENAA